MNPSNIIVDNVGDLHLLFIYSDKCQAGKEISIMKVRMLVL